MQQRVLPLEAGHNFRDLGGYVAEGGMRVRKGLVYRSGTLAHITANDQALLAAMDIKIVCDFRANDERARKPSQWHVESATEFWCRDHPDSVGNLFSSLANPAASAQDALNVMCGVYETLAFEQAESYREVFLRLADGQVPLVFHCSAGKDRTGVAAALLLTHLGVDRETIVADYLISDSFFEQCRKFVTADDMGVSLRAVDAQVWEPLLRAERAYLETMFATVEEKMGSIGHYLRHTLGLSEATLQQVRENLLEPA